MNSGYKTLFGIIVFFAAALLVKNIIVTLQDIGETPIHYQSLVTEASTTVATETNSGTASIPRKKHPPISKTFVYTYDSDYSVILSVKNCSEFDRNIEYTQADCYISEATSPDPIFTGPVLVAVQNKKTKEIILVRNSFFSFVAKESLTESPAVVFQDVNFDGIKDIAIHIDNSGGYGAPRYEFYLYDTLQNTFVKNEILSAMALEKDWNGINPDKKILSFYTKSGCCEHSTYEYSFVNNHLVPVRFEKIMVDPHEDGETAKVTTQTEIYVNGILSTTTEKIGCEGVWATKRFRTENLLFDVEVSFEIPCGFRGDQFEGAADITIINTKTSERIFGTHSNDTLFSLKDHILNTSIGEVPVQMADQNNDGYPDFISILVSRGASHYFYDTYILNPKTKEYSKKI